MLDTPVSKVSKSQVGPWFNNNQVLLRYYFNDKRKFVINIVVTGVFGENSPHENT